MIRLAFVTNIVPHYRETFYLKLFKNYDHLLLSSLQLDNSGRPSLNYSILDNHKLLNDNKVKIGDIEFIIQKGALKLVNDFNPDIVIALGLSRYITNWGLLIWAKLKKRKSIVWTSGWERMDKRGLVYRIKRIMNFFYYNLADFILVYSTKGKEYIEPLLFNKNKIKVCFNGLEIDNLIRNEEQIRKSAIELRNSPQLEKVFLYVGGMIREKKVDLLILAFKELCDKYNNIKLWLVGNGPDIDYFKSLSNQDEKIIFWGRKVDDVDIYFAASDFFVMPGLGGLALNQAMFWGKPCIVAEADGTEDDLILEKITGYRFLNNDKHSLQNAMEKLLLDDNSKYVEMSEECKNKIINRSNVNNMVNTFIDTINNELKC